MITNLFNSIKGNSSKKSHKQLPKNQIPNEDRRIAWIDVETNGKTPRDGSRLLQVACIITDGNLKELNGGLEIKVYHSKDAVKELYKASDPIVKAMHENTGLWNKLPKEGLEIDEVEERLFKELKQYIPRKGMAKLGGNSITLDRNFLEAELPHSFNYLSYRSYDMSSVAEHYKLNAPNIPSYPKDYGHDALNDIRESIAEAIYYSQILKTLIRNQNQ